MQVSVVQVAAADAEMQMQERVLQRSKYMSKLTDVFVAADTSGDGKMSLQEFQALMEVPNVLTMFQCLDLEIHEVISLFNLLDNGDGIVTQEEFLNGVMRLKGHARSLDIVAISKDLQTVMTHQDMHTEEMNKFSHLNGELLQFVRSIPRQHGAGQIIRGDGTKLLPRITTRKTETGDQYSSI